MDRHHAENQAMNVDAADADNPNLVLNNPQQDEDSEGEEIQNDTSDEELHNRDSDYEDEELQNRDSDNEDEEMQSADSDEELQNIDSDEEIQDASFDSDNGSIADSDGSMSIPEDDDNPVFVENVIADETFSLDMNGVLQVRLRTAADGNMLAWETFLLTIAKTLRFKESYISMLSSFQILNQGFINRPFPQNMNTFWKLVNRRDDHFTNRVVCTVCWAIIGNGREPTRDCNCFPVQCGPNRNNAQMGTYCYINLRSQIEALLRKNNIATDLLYPYTRTKLNDEAIEDVYDGSVYRENSAGQFLHRNNHNYSLAMWVDGVSPVKSAKVHIVPVFFQVLELSPRARQRNSLLAAVYVGPRKPLMASFLTSITVALHELYEDGVTWRPNVNEERISRFKLLIVSADSEERYAILGMTRHNGRMGCTCCLVQGVPNQEAANRTRVYPVGNDENIQDRTDAGIRLDSEISNETGREENGVQSISALYPLVVDLRTSQLMEPLHLFWKGNYVRLHKNCTNPNRPNHILPRNLATISRRITAIRTPTKLSRLPRDLTNFPKFTGTEQRNNGWHYWLPCAQDFLTGDQLRLFALFAEATFILSKGSILQEELDRASQLLIDYRRLFQNLFPAEEWTYNVHLLKHATRSVRELGPSFVASGFWFESLNRQVVNFLTSPTARALQVANRMLLAQMIEKYLDMPLTPTTRRTLQEFIGKGRWTERPNVAAGTFVQLFGNGTQAVISGPQIAALAEAGFDHIDPGMLLIKHKKVCVGGVMYQVPREGRVPKYNNSIAYVNTEYQGEIVNYIDITAIVNWQREGEEMIGIFGKRFHTVGPAFETTYMHVVERRNDLVYVAASDLINAAVLVEACERVYISRLPNRWEND